jgi:hypothetical protein
MPNSARNSPAPLRSDLPSAGGIRAALELAGARGSTVAALVEAGACRSHVGGFYALQGKCVHFGRFSGATAEAKAPARLTVRAPTPCSEARRSAVAGKGSVWPLTTPCSEPRRSAFLGRAFCTPETSLSARRGTWWSPPTDLTANDSQSEPAGAAWEHAGGDDGGELVPAVLRGLAVLPSGRMSVPAVPADALLGAAVPVAPADGSRATVPVVRLGVAS